MRFILTSLLAVVVGFGAMNLSIDSSRDIVSYNTWLQSIKLNEAEAKSRSSSSSRSFSSRSSSSYSYKRSSSGGSSSLWNRTAKPKPTVKSSSGYKKVEPKKTSTGYKKVEPKKTSTVASTSGGYGKAGTNTTTDTKRKFGSKTGSVGKVTQRKAVSKGMKKHKAETAKFTKPNTIRDTASLSNNKIVRSTKTVDKTTYYKRRDTYYRDMDWEPPRYVYLGAPSYGIYDSYYVHSRFDRDPSFFYHNQAVYAQLRLDMEREARRDAELAAKMARVDAEIARMKSKGVAVQEGYITSGDNAGVALAADIATSTKLEIAMGVGGKKGSYNKFCQKAKQEANGLPVKCVNTNGSIDILNGLASGKFGAGIVQSNVLNEYLRDNPGVKIDALQATLYPEVVFLIANRKAGVDSIKDINRKHRLYYFGSGATKTMIGFAKQDSGYKNITRNGVQVTPNRESLQMVANNPNGVMMYVCSMNCDLVKTANDEFGDKLVMAAVDDWNFNNHTDQYGNDIYRFVNLPETYGNLQEGGIFSSGDTKTLAVDAVLIVTKDWAEEKGTNGLSKLEAAVWPSMNYIQNEAGVPEE